MSQKFSSELIELKKIIDEDISSYCAQILSETVDNFGDYPTEAVRAYCELLNRGGKRIRGALVITAYEMLGGTDISVALQAARAIEMLHAYILIVDDIQDNSEIRRGGPTAHMQLMQYHEAESLSGDSEHFGVSVALNGALFGVHSALNILANLEVTPEVRLQIIKNVNKNFVATAHGQTLDIFNEVVGMVDEEYVDKVLLWKTAYYTFMNPLQLGAMLAGASQNDLDLLEKYSLHAGRAFQITDDILGIYGEEKISGKNPMDDLKEGKRTLLTVKALEMTSVIDANYLRDMLGNKNLKNEEFIRCREIIESSGALQYAQQKAKESVVEATQPLQKAPGSWNPEQVQFLSQLVQFLIDRKS